MKIAYTAECEEVCPQDCIKVQKRKLAQDGSLSMDGKTIIDQKCCAHCGWCASICPVGAITVKKTAIWPDMKKKQIFEKKLTAEPTPRPALTSTLITDEETCLGCGNCVIICPVNSLSDPYLAAGHLNEIDTKPLLAVENGKVKVVDQEVCGSCATCSMICPTDAIWLEKREVA